MTGGAAEKRHRVERRRIPPWRGRWFPRRRSPAASRRQGRVERSATGNAQHRHLDARARGAANPCVPAGAGPLGSRAGAGKRAPGTLPRSVLAGETWAEQCSRLDATQSTLRRRVTACNCLRRPGRLFVLSGAVARGAAYHVPFPRPRHECIRHDSACPLPRNATPRPRRQTLRRECR